jgi:hypothetical protein
MPQVEKEFGILQRKRLQILMNEMLCLFREKLIQSILIFREAPTLNDLAIISEPYQITIPQVNPFVFTLALQAKRGYDIIAVDHYFLKRTIPACERFHVFRHQFRVLFETLIGSTDRIVSGYLPDNIPCDVDEFRFNAGIQEAHVLKITLFLLRHR